MPFEPEDVTTEGTWEVLKELLDGRWHAILQHSCSFSPKVFEDVSLNLIHNPNINSTVLFRADILYDSAEVTTHGGAVLHSDERALPDENLHSYSIAHNGFPGFTLKQTIVRKMIPRNPQLDKPVAQTCQIFESNQNQNSDLKHTLVIYVPHVSCSSEIPWYHPNVQSLAYLHSCPPPKTQTSQSMVADSSPSILNGLVSVHYRLFSDQTFPLSDRLRRTAHQLLSTLHKHGQGILNGYTKRVHHDQLISQQRVQDTYTRLKAAHAKRLCDHWAEQTDSSKHVFEDLSIAAFLIELWKDMYAPITLNRISKEQESSSADFPGFVDIGCGNGVLVDILLREGYKGWGFDARNRKSWAIFQSSTQRQLKQMILVPQPLLEMNPTLHHKNKGDTPKLLSRLHPRTMKPSDATIDWHDGIFPKGTFVISNHADELTPWTPLLAYLSLSPFLMIPCCSHNLSGLRFRAPSKFNGYSADTFAPLYFAGSVTKAKSVAITIAPTANEDQQPKQGCLKELSTTNRAKQPSAYAALCDWVTHLAAAVGYEVEKEMLRLPSTRNTGLVGRNMDPIAKGMSAVERMEKVKIIAVREGADGVAWVSRAKSLVGGKGETH
ncbi:MAG: hypothetical protein Q9182_005632 [Xanthomendoza sp. 2 TL-2023]